MKSKTFLSIIALWCLLVWLTRTPEVQAQLGSPCNRTVAISVAGGASQTIQAAVPGQVWAVCAFVISGDTIQTTGQFVSGSTNLTGAMRMCDECNIPSGDGSGVLFETPGGGALTLTAVTGAITGFVKIGPR